MSETISFKPLPSQFIPTGPNSARVMIVGEAPGDYEVRAGRPFVGPSGQLLDTILHEVGVLRADCFVTNVCRVQPTGNDIECFFMRRKTKPKTPFEWHPVKDGWARPEVLHGLDLLKKEIALVQPNVIIALGNLALWALTGLWGVSKWRGSLLKSEDGIKVVPTLHPAAVLRQWSDRRYMVHDLRRAAKEQHTRELVEPHYNFIIKPHFPAAFHALDALRRRLAEGPVHLACDIETRAGHIACIGFAWSKTEALCIPLMCVERPPGYWSIDEEVVLVGLMREILEHPNARISGQNFIYDVQYLWRHYKMLPTLALDTMLTHHVCFPGTEKGLDVLASLYCEFYRYWKDDGKEWHQRTGEIELWRYNCLDCVRTWEIAEALPHLVEQMRLVDQCVFQHEMWWRALETMIRGVRTDLAARAALSKNLAEEAASREQWLTEILGHPLNVRSGPQMKALFYEDFRLPEQHNRRTGAVTLDDEALSKLCAKEPLIRPLVRRIRELRSIGVFRSTFVEARLDVDQRIRCSYNVAGTETFRLSSSENAFGSGMNLQNVPSGGADGEEPDALVLPNVRKLFLPDPGYEIADMDLSSADLRIVVWEADEPEMKAMLAAGLDPYTEIAKEFYRDRTISKADPRRQKFKSFAHGTNYLGSPRGLAQRLGLSIAEAERTQSWYFGRFPRIQQWQGRLKSRLASERRVSNIFGYHRFFFDRIEGTVANQAAAWIPQSTVGLLINKIWSRIVREVPEVQVLLQVHDSLVMQYPIVRAQEYRAKLQELSRIPLPYADPCTIPTGFKYSQTSWGDCK